MNIGDCPHGQGKNILQATPYRHSLIERIGLDY